MLVNYNTINTKIDSVNYGEVASVAPLAKPIETLQNTIENTLDDFTDVINNEKNKKSNKAAIAAGSSIIVLSGLVLLLNPKYSNKLIEKVKIIREKNKPDLKTAQDNSFWQNIKVRGLDLFVSSLEFTNNINSVKDIYFKKLCTSQKTSSAKRSGFDLFGKADRLFVKIMRPIHEKTTNLFDKIAQKTVILKYKSANKKINSLDKTIGRYIEKLPDEKKREVQELLLQANSAKNQFGASEVMERLKSHEDLMKNLEDDVIQKFNEYKEGFTVKQDRKGHFERNLYFWAQDIMQPLREIIEYGGVDRVSKVFENENGDGIYQKIYKIIAEDKSLSDIEIKHLKQEIDKCNKVLKNANDSECIKYFDKKRDLVLGSAPTDILTAFLGLSASGIVISSTKDKDKKISRCLTAVFPIIAGLGASIAFTAMLFSGTTGLLLGAGTSVILSKIGSKLDSYRIKNKQSKEGLHNEISA